MKLNQLIALVSGHKTKKHEALKRVYQTVQKTDLFNGLSRTYQPKDEENGEKFEPESKLVQLTARDAMNQAIEACETMFNLIAAQDIANTEAIVDIKIDDKIFISKVPVTHLLFLEKQLTDLHTFVNTFPVLDPSEKWVYSENDGFYRSEEKSSIKTKKTLKNHVKAEATDKHPAQVDVYSDDVTIGNWTTIKFSGAFKADEKKAIVKKVEALQAAVKMAREEANSIEVKTSDIGTKVLNYIFK